MSTVLSSHTFHVILPDQCCSDAAAVLTVLALADHLWNEGKSLMTSAVREMTTVISQLIVDEPTPDCAGCWQIVESLAEPD